MFSCSHHVINLSSQKVDKKCFISVIIPKKNQYLFYVLILEPSSRAIKYYWCLILFPGHMGTHNSYHISAQHYYCVRLEPLRGKVIFSMLTKLKCSPQG